MKIVALDVGVSYIEPRGTDGTRQPRKMIAHRVMRVKGTLGEMEGHRMSEVSAAPDSARLLRTMVDMREACSRQNIIARRN